MLRKPGTYAQAIGGFADMWRDPDDTRADAQIVDAHYPGGLGAYATDYHRAVVETRWENLRQVAKRAGLIGLALIVTAIASRLDGIWWTVAACVGLLVMFVTAFAAAVNKLPAVGVTATTDGGDSNPDDGEV